MGRTGGLGEAGDEWDAEGVRGGALSRVYKEKGGLEGGFKG